MSEERLWLSASEAAAKTGYHRDHVQNLARDKVIVAEKTPNGYMIYMPSLLEYRERMEEKGRGPGSGGAQKPEEADGK